MKKTFRLSAQVQFAIALFAGIVLLACMRESGLFHDWELAVFPPLLAVALLPLPQMQYKSLYVLTLGPVAAFFIVELLNQTHLWEDFMPWQVVMNLAWYALIFFVCRLILGRDRRAAAAGALLCAAAGLANHYVYSFRGRIIFPSDLDPSAILTALNVAGNYDYGLNVSICRALIVLACYLILVARCPAQPCRVPLHRPVIAVTIVGYAIYIVLFFFSPMLPKSKSSYDVILAISGKLKAARRTAAEIRIDFAVFPLACLNILYC